jgi:DNA repair protein RadC
MRPRERMLMDGVSSLNDTELLAVLIGSGLRGRSAEIVAEDLLAMTDHDLQTLGKLTPEGYAVVPGIGKARATLISAAMELGRRRTAENRIRRNKITSSRDVFNRYVDRLCDLGHEEFHVLLLKRSNDVLAELKISSGGLSGTVADPKIIFGKSLALGAAAIVVVHNHPSGNPKPSQCDINLTNNLVKAGKFLDLPVLDHIIIAGKSFSSFSDSGLM